MHRLGPLEAVEIVITMALFLANLFISALVHRSEFVKRLPYMGQEMTFLALGLIVVRFSSAHSKDALVVLVITMFVFLLAWLGVMLLTEAIVENAKLWRNPLVGLTMLIGIVFVYLALADVVFGFVERQLTSGAHP